MTDLETMNEDWLREHGRSLRGLGRALLRDASGAEDLAQEAFASALEGTGHVTNLAAWLRTVTRRVAGKSLRERERRTRRERAVARSERLSSAADLAARAEVVRRIGEVVAGLPEPYREVILLRFFEDLPPRHIADRLGAPVATVDSRLRRGLALMRTELERGSHGEARHWSVLLAGALTGASEGPAPGVPALEPASSITPWIGGLAALKASLLVLVGAGVVTVALLVGVFRPTPEPRDPGPLDAVRRSAPAAPALGVSVEEARQPLPATALAEEPAPVTEAAPVPAPLREVRGVVLGPGGRGVAGAQVLIGASRDELRAATVSDASGAFVTEVAQEDRWAGARAAGFGPSAILAMAESGSQEERDLRLYLPTIGVALEVRVSGPSGMPIDGALVRVGREQGRVVRQPDGSLGSTRPYVGRTTDPGGVARFDGLSPGWQRVAVQSADLAPRTSFVTLRADEPNLLEVVLEEGFFVEGVVSDESGEPVAGASISRGGSPGRTAHSGEDGRYRLGPIDSGSVQVRGPLGRRFKGRLSGAAGQVVRWDVRLGTEQTLRGRVLDALGEPLVGGWVSAHHETWPGWTDASVTDEEGWFEIHGCPESELLRLEVRRAAGDALPCWVAEGLRAGTREREIRLSGETAELRGTLVGMESVAGLELYLQHRATEQRQRLTSGPGARVSAGEDGVLELEALAPGDYQLVVVGEPYGWLRLAAFELAPGEARDLGRLVLPVPGRLRTELLVPAGTPVATPAFLLERREAYQTLLRLDGTFPEEISLAPGNYVLEVELTPGPRTEHAFTIASDRETLLRIDLKTTCRHLVRLRQGSGRPAAGAVDLEIHQLDLSTEHLVERTEVKRTVDGDWIHEVELEPGRFRFTARFPGGETASRVHNLFTSEPGREVAIVSEDR